MPPTAHDECVDAINNTNCRCLVYCGSEIDGEPSTEDILQNPLDSIATRLTRLNLSGQGLSSLPETEELVNLHVLNLSKNDISELPEKLVSSQFLRVLDVSHNKLKWFPQVLLKGLFIVKELNLSYNDIRYLPRPKCHQHLTVLTARSCNLSEFPLWILQEMHFLEILDLSLNSIFLNLFVPEVEFHQSCNNLKRVNFSNTYFSDHYVKIISKFSQLEYLDVSNYSHKFMNSISGLEDKLPQTLKVFRARNCRLIAKANLAGTATEKANMSHNTIMMLHPDTISTHMRFLVLNDSYIVSLPENFGTMKHLSYLNLSHNDLNELPPSFADLKELRHLDLYQNSFSDFPYEQLQNLKNITCFDMCMNLIDIPAYPLGEGTPSYERLRRALRSAFKGERNNGKIPASGSEYSDEYAESETSYCQSSEDEANSDPPRSPVRTLPEQEEECWDSVEPESMTIYKDILLSNHFRGPGDPFAGELEQDFLQIVLRLVPARIRDGPFFFYRPQLPSVVAGSACVNVAEELPVEGQFDDV